MENPEQILRNNESLRNFEWYVNGMRSFIEYKRKGDTLYLTHTEVPKELEGKGIAAAMVKATLEYIESKNWKIVVYCPYIKVYLQKHPEWNRLVDPNHTEL